jgi:L-seryl-tRNA(Ser) seleniumtransferase
VSQGTPAHGRRAENGHSVEVQQRLRMLPSVDEVLRQVADLAAPSSASKVERVHSVRQALEQARERVRAGAEPPDMATIARAAADQMTGERERHLRPVINATGVIINTNLGRAPLSAAAIRAMTEVAAGYSNLEYDLEAGARGSRHTHVRDLLRQVTGAEDALVVNNNAAAVLVVLSALAAGRSVIVSRGELVEIGGGFRVPDVMRQSGARLVEVGTTNRTRLADYIEAVSDDTAALLAVHPSNFRIVGFTEAPERSALARAARERGLMAIEDLGSGCLLPTERYGLQHEPTPTESIAAGVDVVCFSGDKLLGGPQAGLIVGRTEVLARIERNPLMRAVRIDKLTLAALEATLQHYRDGTAESEVPVWRMIDASVAAIRTRALTWAERLTALGLSAAVVEGDSTVGGGSLPGETLPTALCAVERPEGVRDAADMAARLRGSSTPVVARVLHSRLLLDPRTVLPEQDEALLTAVERCLRPRDSRDAAPLS